MARRGSYFYVIDAFVASIIVISAVAVLFYDFNEKTPAVQAFYTAEDFLTILDGTPVKDYDANLTRNWTMNGTINDSSLSLLQQIALFSVTGGDAEELQLANLTIQDVPEQVNARIYVGSAPSRLIGAREILPEEDAVVFFSSKRIVLLRQSPTDLYPPVLIEVQTWQ